jgi:hypothetical protein
MAFVGVGLFLSRPGPGAPVPWARLGTQDVHSLAFVGDDPQHLLFGHHNGIAETRDGGKTWAPLPVGEDAMGMVAADDGSIVIAGHLVFTASRDGGQTWAPISTDLPSLDIHGFTRDPSDPARMWAHPATGFVEESRLRRTVHPNPRRQRPLSHRRRCASGHAPLRGRRQWAHRE